MKTTRTRRYPDEVTSKRSAYPPETARCYPAHIPLQAAFIIADAPVLMQSFRPHLEEMEGRWIRWAPTVGGTRSQGRSGGAAVRRFPLAAHPSQTLDGAGPSPPFWDHRRMALRGSRGVLPRSRRSIQPVHSASGGSWRSITRHPRKNIVGSRQFPKGPLAF